MKATEIHLGAGPSPTCPACGHGSKAAVYFGNLYCSSCLNAANVKVAPCKGENVCMRSIPVEDVLKESLHLLGEERVPADDLARWSGYGGKFTRMDWVSWREGSGAP
jgi:hypothetical protein